MKNSNESENLLLEYENDLLNGTSKYYDITGSLIAEGVYKDSLKTGIWKFYHDNITDENSLPLEYSKKLYKESNYFKNFIFFHYKFMSTCKIFSGLLNI